MRERNERKREIERESLEKLVTLVQAECFNP